MTPTLLIGSQSKPKSATNNNHQSTIKTKLTNNKQASKHTNENNTRNRNRNRIRNHNGHLNRIQNRNRKPQSQSQSTSQARTLSQSQLKHLPPPPPPPRIIRRKTAAMTLPKTGINEHNSEHNHDNDKPKGNGRSLLNTSHIAQLQCEHFDVTAPGWPRDKKGSRSPQPEP